MANLQDYGTVSSLMGHGATRKLNGGNQISKPCFSIIGMYQNVQTTIACAKARKIVTCKSLLPSSGS
jgi:hypothetical protein